MSFLKIFFSVLALQGLFNIAYADILKELQIYESCYKKFTGNFFNLRSLYVENIRNEELSGAEACMQLLSHANLTNSSGELNGKTLNVQDGNFDNIGIDILRTFYQLHGSFAPHGPTHDERGNDAEPFLYDYNSHANYFTKHLFTPLDSSGHTEYPFYMTFSDTKTYKTMRSSPFSNDRWQLFDYWKDTGGVLCTENCTLPLLLSSFPEEMRNKTDGVHTYVKDIFGDNKVYDLNMSKSEFGVTVEVVDFPVVQQFGTIVGIEEAPVLPVPNISLKPLSERRNDGYNRHFMNPNIQPYPFKLDNLYFNPGLGAFSTPSGMLTWQFFDGDGGNAVQNGADKVPRIWAETFISKMLCRELPVIRFQDAQKYVDYSNHELTFRSSSFCMGCHATMDSLANLTRGYRKERTSDFVNGNDGYRMYVNYFLKPLRSLASEEGLRPSADDLFALRPPDADFRFRDMYGKLHDVHFDASYPDEPFSDFNGNLQEGQFKSYHDLAKYLATLDDTYACFASKYLNFLTGIEVTFFDPGQDNIPKLSARERKIYEWVQNLGHRFKEHNSARLLIDEIVKSELFLDPYTGEVPKF